LSLRRYFADHWSKEVNYSTACGDIVVLWKISNLNQSTDSTVPIANSVVLVSRYC